MGTPFSRQLIQFIGICGLGLSLISCAVPSRYESKIIPGEFIDAVQPAMVSGQMEGDPILMTGSTTQDANQGPISLPQAIALARQKNPDMQMARARIQSAGAKLEGAESPFYPRLSVYTEYMKGDAPSAYLFKTIDQRQLPPNTDFNAPGSFDNWESGLTARWNLYNGGRDQLQRQMAASSVNAAHWDRHDLENRLVTMVIQAFYDARAAKEFIKTAEASVATVQSQLKVMTVRFRGGGALKSDILSLEVRLAQAREELVRSQNQYRIAQAALTNALGIEPDPDLELADTPATVPSPELPTEMTGGLASAVTQRPELAKVAEGLRQARLSLDSAHSGYLPRVNLEAKYYLDDPDFSYDLDRDNWFAAVVLNWDLFNGFSTRMDISGASSAIREVLAAERKTLLEVKFDVQRAYLNLDAAGERLKVARSAVNKAEESLDLVKKQYEGGSATVTRYLEAELDRNQARIRAIAARYDREKARAEIGRAIGHWANAPQPQKETQ